MNPVAFRVGVAQKLVSRAVKLVRSGTHGRVDHAAADAAVFRAEVAGDHFEFGKRIGRRLHHLARIALVAGRIGVVIQPVQQEIVIGAAHAVHVERAFARRAGGRKQDRHGRTMHVRGKQREIGIIAAVQRQLDNLLRVDHLPVFARVGFEHLGGALHVDGLADCADLHGDVDALARIHRHVDTGGFEGFEAGELGRNGVSTYVDVEEIVIAGIV